MENDHSTQPDQVGPLGSNYQSSLTLPRSVRKILHCMQEEWEANSSKRSASYSRGRRDSESTSSGLTDSHRRIKMRLSPLISVEEVLTRKLFPTANGAEISVRAGSGWVGYLSNMISRSAARPRSAGATQSDDATTILSNCRDDIVSLWQDDVIRQILEDHGVRLQEMPGL
jgi:hypothetical protein